MYSLILILVSIFTFEGRFVFPQEYPEESEVNLLIPEECLEVGICEDIPDYPEELADKLIDELMSHHTTFNKDMLMNDSETVRRQGPEGEDVKLCASRERLFFPRAAQDMNMDWHLVLNSKKKPVQSFRVEVCASNEQPCSPIGYAQQGYKVVCEQKSTLRKMFVISDDEKKAKEIFVPLPSCCTCVARSLA
ncbi:uncharacterized protein [Maniola hyperantus]|uniref:uncharacterized protein n=1 Tax=Aphantopus hyperantus TaxID=2795564 RepID=UPI0037487AAB